MNYETEDKKRKIGIEKTDFFAQTDSTKAMPENILHELCECKAEDKVIDYKELTIFEQKIMQLVNRTTYDRRIIDAEGAKYAAKLLLPYAKKQLE